jgi:hypothetical protein
MSEYTILHFHKPEKHSIQDICDYIELDYEHDAFSIKRKVSDGTCYYSLTLSEGTLYDFIDLLHALKDKFCLSFYVEYGTF